MMRVKSFHKCSRFWNVKLACPYSGVDDMHDGLDVFGGADFDRRMPGSKPVPNIHPGFGGAFDPGRPKGRRSVRDGPGFDLSGNPGADGGKRKPPISKPGPSFDLSQALEDPPGADSSPGEHSERGVIEKWNHIQKIIDIPPIGATDSGTLSTGERSDLQDPSADVQFTSAGVPVRIPSRIMGMLETRFASALALRSQSLSTTAIRLGGSSERSQLEIADNYAGSQLNDAQAIQKGGRSWSEWVQFIGTVLGTAGAAKAAAGRRSPQPQKRKKGQHRESSKQGVRYFRGGVEGKQYTTSPGTAGRGGFHDNWASQVDEFVRGGGGTHWVRGGGPRRD